MKFAKELEDDLVPEWRAKYFDYRTGKKKLKAVSRALRSVNTSPKTPKRRTADLWHGLNQHNSPEQNLRHTFLNRHSVGYTDPDGTRDYLRHAQPRPDSSSDGDDGSARPLPSEASDGMSVHNPDESDGDKDTIPRPAAPPSLELPDPAIDPSNAMQTGRTWRESDNSAITAQSEAPTPTKSKKLFGARRKGTGTPKRPLTARIISAGNATFGRNAETRDPDIPLEAYRLLDIRQAEFFTWMNQEFNKIEKFYKEKEDESNERLIVLREQLHEMRDRRLDEVIKAQRTKDKATAGERDGLLANAENKLGGVLYPHGKGAKWMKPLGNVFDSARGKPHAHFGTGTRALHDLGSPQGPQPRHSLEEHQSRRDSVRRPPPMESVPYRTAKRKLKLALQEYYRGLELLKAYALLNRTAFRKMNKKYDKCVNARPPGRYMSEKVNKAWFVQSEVLDGHLHSVEDLYARYFERGNHKIAIGKLRSKVTRGGEYYSNVYRNGLSIGAGIVFGIQGLVNGANLLKNPDPVLRTNTGYLLQLYAGYFLALLLFLLFCLDCRVWNSSKINYVFIFEFDTHHNLDWRQLCELPCIFFLLEGLVLWLNFGQYGPESLYIYYPVILVGLTVLILIFPARILYHRSRKWWMLSNGRLLLAGLKPVEFRDFFLGDMYCSQTYSMGNLELFFCLYAKHWNTEYISKCNSQNSALLGFFSTLPGIWRALQCLRRYYDTGNAFPHLANAGKYTFTVLFYMSLSLYRIHKTNELRAFFIFCAVVNSTYCSVWDLIMDWSLGNPYARYPFLRDVLGYKQVWIYYVAMIIDPILRFNWIFYAIYSHDLQHSAILSFLIGLSEVLRRGMWTLFRVENEHCTNVGRFRASRDIPLPYSIDTPSTTSVDTTNQARKSPDQGPSTSTPHASGVDLERQDTTASTGSSTLQRRRSRAASTPLQRGMSRVGALMSQAHAQDFERKRRPGAEDEHADHDASHGPQSFSSDEDDDDEEDAMDEDNQRDVADAESLMAKDKNQRRS